MTEEKCRCSKLVYIGEYGRRAQCSRAGVIERDGKLWCKQHDPEAIAKRRADRDARWAAKNEAERYTYAMERWRSGALSIVEQIAQGHNDPRSLALEYLYSGPKKHGDATP